MQIPPFFAVQKQNTLGVVTIIASDNYTLDVNDLNPSADFRIFADTLTLPSTTFALPGKNISIYARSIICQAGSASVLDTSGAPPAAPIPPINPSKADSGTGAGAGGQNGLDGGSSSGTVGANGQNAGAITINASSITGSLQLKSMGAQGQQGQDGQNGGDGIQGSHGADAVIRYPIHDGHHGAQITPATKGGDGGPAGNGGRAGASGNGGAGGAVQVNTITALTEGQIEADVSGGHAGAPTQGGTRGGAGAAGEGGRVAEEHYVGSSHMRHEVWQLGPNRQAGARSGREGVDGGPAPQPGVDGAAGSYSPTTITDLSSMLIEDECLLSQLLLTMRVAEIYYLESDFTTARSKYEWISGLTASASGSSGLSAEFSALHRSCRALLDQLNQGLDFFGNPLNYVPIVTLDYYQQSLDEMLEAGSHIEDVYNTYTLYIQQQTANFTEMDDAIAKANNAISTYQDAQVNTGKQIADVGRVIDQLSSALATQYSVLLEADATFQSAAEKVNNGCSFANLLALVKTLLAVAKVGYDISKATEAGMLLTPISGLLDVGINIDTGKITSPLTTRGDISDISAAWSTLNPSGSGDISDSTKLVLVQEDFDKAIQPYLDLPEAKNYEAQMHDYIGIAQSRNAKIIEYTNDIIQYISLSSQITQKQEEVKRIQADIATENIPNLIPYQNFLFGLYQDYKTLCLKYLYQENRALVYWSQAPSEFAIEDDSFSGLEQFHSELKAKILDYINNSGQPDQPLNDIKVSLSSDTRAPQFQKLADTNSISFQIETSDNDFLGWANIMLTNFRIFVPDLAMPSTGQAYIRLRHQGQVTVINPDGIQSAYTHNQVVSVYEYSLDQDGKPVFKGGGSLGGDTTGSNPKRIALSPFATFTLEFPPEYNQGLNLENVRQIDCWFTGRAQPAASQTRKALA